MRLSTLILPIYRWPEGRRLWSRAEELGFHAAYTYDHLSWRQPFTEGPWFGAIPTLTAAAGVTTRLRLGTLVTTPNFRHPVTLAKELLTLDDIAEGRLTVGIGAGRVDADATVLGAEPTSQGERTRRFEEFVPLLDQLLREPLTTYHGKSYTALQAWNVPGCVQRPRVPFAIAANGPRGMRLAAEYGQSWVTTGDAMRAADLAPADCPQLVRDQTDQLAAACTDVGRDPADLARVLLTGFTPEKPWTSVDAFVDFAGRYAEAGAIDEIVVHWPVPDSRFEADQAVFERIATEAPRQML